MVTGKLKEDECEFCGYKYTDEVIKIANEMEDIDPCYCSIIDNIYKLKKKVKKLQKNRLKKDDALHIIYVAENGVSCEEEEETYQKIKSKVNSFK